MLLGPEQERGVQHDRVRYCRGPHLCQPDSVIPYSAFWDQCHAEYTVGQEQLNPFGHVGIEAL